MTYLIAGLILFLGIHSTRIFADGWRTQQLKRFGEGAWKGLYSLFSIAGFVLLIYGYGLARQAPVDLWFPPVWTRHLAALLTLIAFVLIVAAFVPKNHYRRALGHPMLAGTKIWAFAHLASNGRLADVLLFGGFMVWAIVAFAVCRRRDRKAGKTYPPGKWGMTAIATVVGVAAWVGFALWAHGVLIGVRPFG